jgi:hypothetical protein
MKTACKPIYRYLCAHCGVMKSTTIPENAIRGWCPKCLKKAEENGNRIDAYGSVRYLSEKGLGVNQ